MSYHEGLRCDICGKHLAMDVLMGKPAISFRVKGIEEDLDCHDDCNEVLQKAKEDWHHLPAGPLRSAFHEAQEVL